MKLSIVGRTYKANIEGMERVAQAAFSYLPAQAGEVELKFVSEKEIVRLNNVYRGLNKPTDILSFNISAEPLVGQLFICYTYLVKQAQQVGKTLDDELALLIVHGILHVYGYDHAKQADEVEMQQIETTILKREGIVR